LPIKSPLTKTEHVYAGIRQDILDGRLVPDQRLRLAELATKYQTSAMPVREALRMLHRDGLIFMHNHRGATVSSSSPELAYQYAEARGVIETAAVKLAAPFHTTKTLAHLRSLQDQLKKAAQNAQPEKFRELNQLFHVTVCDPCQNDILKETLEDLWGQIRRVSVQSLVGTDKKRMARSIVEHEAIIDAIAKGDADGAGAAMQLHSNETISAWRRVIGAASAADMSD
jgi:DNA-binding GntR family transcriptional regulator